MATRALWPGLEPGKKKRKGDKMERVDRFIESGAGSRQAAQDLDSYLSGREQERAEIQAEVDRVFWDALLTGAGELAAG